MEGGVDHPIVFISHFTVRAGKLDRLKLVADEIGAQLEAEKPQTLSFLMYLDDNAAQLTFIHLFADPAAMDLHIQGADERSRAASEFMDPVGWEIYGQPSDAALAGMRQTATSAGAPLTIQADFATGFVRLPKAMGEA